VFYHFESKDEDNVLCVDVKIDCYPQLQKFGVDEYLAKIYGPMVVPATTGYNFSLRLEKGKLPAAVGLFSLKSLQYFVFPFFVLISCFPPPQRMLPSRFPC
jgi:hypothetical protein